MSMESEKKPFWLSKEARDTKAAIKAEKDKKADEAIALRDKILAEQDRLEKIQEAIPKLTPKRVAEIARDKGLWLYDPKSNKWWTPEEYQETFERITVGYEEYVKAVEMRDPVQAISEAGDILQGDIKFEDRDKLLKKFKRFRDFVNRVVGYRG